MNTFPRVNIPKLKTRLERMCDQAEQITGFPALGACRVNNHVLMAQGKYKGERAYIFGIIVVDPEDNWLFYRAFLPQKWAKRQDVTCGDICEACAILLGIVDPDWAFAKFPKMVKAVKLKKIRPEFDAR
ncbi:hypothetical protein [Aestuariicoccus sp. MJ-SS9]|uniref:hypothetical protein n=1 Tax=Aestuariicoccus sp. MJ-SS9 TaxID=3079855 RepID=UPI0029078FB6|nr:hypothetical protein [Aestuariicoccus sp. MJ-SS9]MDU8914198.1 hypothetical protein [Aestuariicoccus sp. MJ-SS9]